MENHIDMCKLTKTTDAGSSAYTSFVAAFRRYLSLLEHRATLDAAAVTLGQ